MKGKPDKYGIKILMMNDAKTFYMVNASPYIEKVLTNPDETVPTYCVRTLSTPIHGTIGNITCDNWFTSVELVKKMLKDYSLTMVGTIRKNKRQIPVDFTRSAVVQSSRFAFDPDMTLVSFTPKK